MIRKPAAFISTISDERGQELLYAGMRISDVFKEDIGLGGVVSLLWFKRRLPVWATKFIEMVLMLTADHGPAVSGAMNTIVATRAGKDLISSLASWLLTIGSRCVSTSLLFLRLVLIGVWQVRRRVGRGCRDVQWREGQRIDAEGVCGPEQESEQAE